MTPCAVPRRREGLLEIEGLVASFGVPGGGRAAAVRGVDLALRRGEALGLVGESGCGKTVLALSILRLLPEPQGRIEAGRIRFKGRDLLRLPPRELNRVRWREIAMVFQEPGAALNPVMPVGRQVAEPILHHVGCSHSEARARAAALLERVGLPEAERTARAYPHQLSGGMQQRAMIAMALACGPDLLVADEPTSALDVTVQAQVLDLLGRLRREEGMALLFITHDLAVLAGLCDRVAVMYAGAIVEEATTEAIFAHPVHPYTEALFRSLPAVQGAGERLAAPGGSAPPPGGVPPGCPFHPRCLYAAARCRLEVPPLEEKANGRRAACHFPR